MCLLKNKKRNRKLLFQVSLIIIAIFILSYAFTVVTDYFMTKNTYLSSKEEMITHDLVVIGDGLNDQYDIKCLAGYMKEHADEVTEKVIDIDNDEYSELYLRFVNGDLDFDEQEPEVQLDLMREEYPILAYQFMLLFGYDYETMSYVFPNEKNKSVVILESGENDGGGENDSGKSYVLNSTLKKIKYEESESRVLKDILDGKLDKAGSTVFEEHYDSESGRSYYNGYIPVTFEGKPIFYLCLKYNWTDFRNELFAHMRDSLISELIIVVVLNTLLMLFLHLNAIRPLSKVTQSVRKYMDDKNSNLVVDAMNKIKIRNEVGVLAGSISELASEIDRYTGENLRLNAEKERIGAELELATKIQSNMLPSRFPAFPEHHEFDIYASMDPAKEVGGDFYDFFFVDEDHLALVIADVSGKGVPAALFMMSSMILIKTYTTIGGTPADILNAVNMQVCSNNEAKMFVTVWLGILEISTGKLTTSSAGHEYPFININGKYELFKDKHGMPIGTFKKSKYRNEELILKTGDSIFVYTDGVAEATDKDNQLFGTERTLEALNTSSDASPKEILKNVRGAVDGFVKDAPQFDDLTMLCLRYNGSDEMPHQAK